MNRTDALNRIEKACLEKGLRMTEQRRVIARVVAEAYDHPDAEELYRRAIAVDPHISIATVYRTVKLFEDAGILERHDFRDGRSRYEEIAEQWMLLAEEMSQKTNGRKGGHAHGRENGSATNGVK